MKRRILAVLLALAVVLALALPALAAVSADTVPYNTGTRHELCTALSAQAEQYYTDGAETLLKLSGSTSDSSLESMDSALYRALQSLMTDTMTDSVTYKSLPTYWARTDASQGKDGLLLFYSDTTGGSMSREHVWPKSRASFMQQNGGSDLHHLRPEDSGVNSTRSNYTMGNVLGVYPDCSTKAFDGKTVLWYSTKNDRVEVADNVKGDLARVLLYVYCRWGQPNLFETVASGSLPPFDGDDRENTGMPVIESLDTLLEWMQEDPVDTWEMSRNDCVQQVQGNRNVFIDYPEFAWLLFGRELSEEPAFSDMPPIPPEPPVSDMPPIPEAAPRKRRNTGMLVSLIALGVVVVGAAVGGFLLWHGMNAKLERERSDHALEQSQAEAQLSDLQDALDQSNENYDALYNDYYDLVQEYSLLQQQNENVSDLQAQYDALSDAYDELSKNYNEFADMAEFYNSNACVASDGNDYYHTYACEDWDRQAFYIFNTAYAENELGLKPCPKCR